MTFFKDFFKSFLEETETKTESEAEKAERELVQGFSIHNEIGQELKNLNDDLNQEEITTNLNFNKAQAEIKELESKNQSIESLVNALQAKHNKIQETVSVGRD